jgi:hypothetical protein
MERSRSVQSFRTRMSGLGEPRTSRFFTATMGKGGLATVSTKMSTTMRMTHISLVVIVSDVQRTEDSKSRFQLGKSFLDRVSGAHWAASRLLEDLFRALHVFNPLVTSVIDIVFMSLPSSYVKGA